LGLYEPAVFVEEAPMMFYALEEDLGYKVPVVFVHGIGGSAKDFEEIVSKLDRTLYKPWFFYYPSGYELSQLSEMFYKIFLSGEVIPVGDMPMVIVAHSMGGLVVRDAMNRYTGKEGETKVKRLITIASPMGGHPDAKMAAKSPVVIPSWRDVAPDSVFMSKLRRKKLPSDLEYHLLYAYGNSTTVKLGENSDGVVPLASQLCSEAQDESTGQYGFNDSHRGILKNADAVKKMIKLIEEVKAPFPEDHMKEYLKGGYNIKLGEDYSPLSRYSIRTTGRWMDALSSGTIKPISIEQIRFVQICREKRSPDNDLERDWLRFMKEYPDRK
jgi:pimeloyl-ACP methyl ester carboxylesterase